MSLTKKLLQAAAGNAGGDNLYVEDVFSTYLYEGNGTSQTITNDIDLDGEGGMVWIKARNTDRSHVVYDSERPNLYPLLTDLTNAELTTVTNGVTSFNADGFSLSNLAEANAGFNYASWTFRKAEKFFDVVTYTGDGVAGRTVAHNLGSVPAVIIVKRTDSAGVWYIYQKDITTGTSGTFLAFDTSAAYGNARLYFGNNTTVVDPTDTEFTVGGLGEVNGSGGQFVAYLFASDAGGFGDDGDESIIKCGSYTGSGGSGQEIDLGFEPQWVLVKNTSRAGQNWVIVDVMRQFDNTGYGWLYPNASSAEASGTGAVYASPTATGFKTYGNNAAFDYLTDSYIYIAIRRPMKTPESGTEVFAVDRGDNSTSNPQFVSGFPVDLGIWRSIGSGNNWETSSRLQGSRYMRTNLTSGEAGDNDIDWDFMTGFYGPVRNDTFYSWMFKRATGFFDVVAYTGTGVAHNEEHNLGVIPEMLILKSRNYSSDWAVWHKDLVEVTEAPHLRLNSTLQKLENDSYYDPSSISSTVFNVGTSNVTNNSLSTFIAYLFASLDGVSKVGSYTGTGADLNVDCGFSAGARFILIKRTDSTGDWYVYDSERGIVAGNDPYLLLNSTAAQVTNTDYIDPLNAGFTVTSSAPAALNASGGSYIFLAIA